MRANNLTISIPNKGCNKSCPYCISKITGYVEYSPLFYGNLDKVKKFAERVGVTSILITGKGEPFLNLNDLNMLKSKFIDYPIEVQTNGIYLNTLFEKEEYLHILEIIRGLSIIAFSLDKVGDFIEYQELFKYLDERDIIVRVTLNITNIIPDNVSIESLINICKISYVKQLSIRDITYPSNADPKNSNVKWIKENNNKGIYKKLVDSLVELESDGEGYLPNTYSYKYPVIRELNFGAKILDIDGIAFTFFDQCVEEKSTNGQIRSLIYQEDGHLYTSWSSKASILF